tara:strand:+ start:2872 stop:3543 length:672 start_codon:yes stop_codon:yes gene_type:complete
MPHNRFQTADNQTGANKGRVGNAGTDQRRFAALSSANGRAKTRPSRGTQSRDTAGGTVFHAPKGRRQEEAIDLDHPWRLTVRKDGEQWKYRVQKGLLNGFTSADFIDTEDENSTWYEAAFTGETQVGLKVILTVTANGAGYVMEGLGSVDEDSLSIIDEEFDDYQFAQNLPQDNILTGHAIVPIGGIIQKDSEDEGQGFKVDEQILDKHVNGVFTVFNGYLVW